MARWTFDRSVVMVNDPTGLLIDGTNPTGVAATGSNFADLSYTGPVNIGSAWSVSVGDPDIDFSPPGAVVAGSGTVS